MSKTRLLVIFVLVTLIFGWHSSARSDQPTADDLLRRADSFRLPNLDNALRVTLKSRKGGEAAGEAEYLVWTRGMDHSRVEMQDPKVKGQRVLMNNDGMWLYLPTTRAAVRITPMQRLMGEASYGDIGRMIWQEDYSAAFAAAEPSVTLNGVAAYRLQLTARRSSAVYTRVDLAVAVADGRPLVADFYLASGKMFKSAVFSPPQNVAGHPVITRIAFTDGIDPEKQTMMEIEYLAPSTLPESAFTQAGLTKN